MRLIRLKEVMHLTGLGRSTLYKFMIEGNFPSSISLGDRAVSWNLDEINEWITIKIESRDAAAITEKHDIPVITETDVISFINNKFKQLGVSDAIAWFMTILN